MSNADRQAQVDKLVKNYKHYQDLLLQVTKKNRSVLLKKIYKKHNFDLANLEELREGTIRKVVFKTVKNIDAALNNKKDGGERQNILLDSIMSDDADAARSDLKTLSRNLGQIEEETGQQTGYFGFPFLQGHANADFYVRGPIVLFPISLQYERKARNGGWFLHLEDKRPILNGALIAALKKKGGYMLPEDYEETFDELIEGASVENGNPEEYFFNRVNDWITTVIPIDQSENQTLTAPLKPLGRDNIETLENQRLHLVSHAIIGNFPQADNEIYKDYDELIKNARELGVGIIGNLVDVEEPNSEPSDFDESHINIDNTSDTELNLVLSSDSSQDEVILESKKSDLVIVRGPPGTGKSQVIVNLISDALTKGKKILVVCQKRAALEVIKQRLGQVELDRYVVFLEKELDDRGKMYRQLHEIIEEETGQGPHISLVVEDISAKIDDCVQYLSGLGKALRREYYGGATAHKLYSKADSQYQPVLDLQSAGLDLDWADLEDYLQKIRVIEPAFKRFEDGDHSWFGRKGFAELGIMEKSNMERLLDELAGLVPRCLLVDSPEGQSRLLSLFDEYVNNSKLLAKENLRLTEEIERIIRVRPGAEFVSENHDSVRNGTKFWTAFGDVLRVFNDEKQNELRMVTSDVELLGERLTSMRESLAEFDTQWMGMENVDFASLRKDVVDKRLQKLIELVPRCLLADNPEGQSRLLSLFDEYIANTGFWKIKNIKTSKEIRKIIRVRPSAEFVSENHDSVRNGTKFWTAFGDVLRVFNDEKQNELRMVTSDVELLGERLTSMRESLAEFDTQWMGMENVDFASLRKDVVDKRLQKLIELVPRCLLADNPEGQSRLLSLFDEYQTELRSLKEKEYNLCREITQTLRTDTNHEFVSENHERVVNGTKFWNMFSDLLYYFDDGRQKEMRHMVDDVESLSSYLRKMRGALEEFDAIQEFDKKKAEYDGDGSILQILSDAKARIGLDEHWAEKIRQEIYAYWLAIIERENPILKGDPISNYQTKRGNLARLMDEKRQAVIAKIQHDISAAINPMEIYTRTSNRKQKEWKDLARELKKRRRLRPVRKLFEQYSNNMLEIAPCWLASPESVSKVFPLERGLFDLVIVDEASQLAVERAIPFLYRAGRVVIAGDEKQLPPFDLFQVREDESEEEDEDISEEKSLLDLARTRYKTINLSWHYRSQHQDLINFSNHAFYEGLLNVAPNAASDPQYPPIRWVKCNGMWENQTNHVEANMVADMMMRIWDGSARKGEHFPSIGVITFNDRQQTLITDIIEKKRESDAEFLQIYASANEGRRKDDSLFVKNIENVQGDERDIIIFSIGYAYNAQGQFVNRFGALNMKGGENRLNVAVTRARREMVVVSSIEPSDIKPTSRHDGPRRLKQFLEYVKATNAFNKKGQEDVLTNLNPGMRKVRDSKRTEFDSDFEAQVYEKLSERGYVVKTQVGFSGYRIDLAVVHPDDENRYVLGIECDGATFHSTKSVRERDVMRQKFLEEKGWIMERIWSRNWWRNPNREIDRLEARIRELAYQKAT